MNSEMIDSQIENQKFKKLWTIRLLIISGTMIVITFILGSLWDVLGLTRKQTVWLAISFMIAFGINIAGSILGITEIKRNKKRALIGLTGNILLIVVFIVLVMYSLTVVP